jgi:hypothetical protein
MIEVSIYLLLTKKDTVERSVIDYAIAADYLCAHLLSQPEYIFVATDGTQEISLVCIFHEIGVFNSNISYLIYDIESTSWDTTALNTRKTSGLGKRLDDRRKEEWIKQGNKE